jgi:hypothetical protein
MKFIVAQYMGLATLICIPGIDDYPDEGTVLAKMADYRPSEKFRTLDLQRAASTDGVLILNSSVLLNRDHFEYGYECVDLFRRLGDAVLTERLVTNMGLLIKPKDLKIAVYAIKKVNPLPLPLKYYDV